MNPTGNQTGSFASPIGGAGIINAAMSARGAQGSPLGQLSPSAPGFNPALAAQPPVSMPQGGMPPPIPQGPPTPIGGAPAPQPAPQAPQAPQTPGGLFSDPQERIIVQALIKQLERIDKSKQMSLGGGAGIGY